MNLTAATPEVKREGFTERGFKAFLAGRRDPSWLVAMRRRAWEAFERLPMPERSHEEWRRTDLRLFRLERFGLPVPPDETVPFPSALLSLGVEDGGQAVSLDTSALVRKLDLEYSSQGVLFGALDQIAAEHGDLVCQWLMQVVDPHYDKLAAMHAAFWSGGTFLYVPPGVKIDRPLHFHSVISDGGVDLAHSLIVLDEGAEATVIAETGGTTPNGGGLHCGAVEIVVGRGARLRYVNLQNWPTGTWHFAHQKARVEQDGNLQWTVGALGARVAKTNQHVALAGQRAHAQVNGVMFTEGRQHLSYHTLQHHLVPRCRSDLLYKGALQDRSHLVWRGMIKVDPDAQKTDGYQRNDSLVLSDGARADSIPGLEIEADDVKCSHGATAGRVDDEVIYYARTRGLTRKEAVRMIVAGFFQQVFDRITIESVRETLGEAIGRRVREYL